MYILVNKLNFNISLHNVITFFTSLYSQMFYYPLKTNSLLSTKQPGCTTGKRCRAEEDTGSTVTKPLPSNKQTGDKEAMN